MSSSVYPTADLAPTGRAKCLHCTQTIDKGSVRIAVLRNIDTGSFITSGPGYLHPACAQTWADTNWEDGFADLRSGVRKHTLMPTLPAPFGGEAGSDEKTAAPAVPKEAPPPPFGQLGSQQIEALVVKLRSLKDEYKTDSALEKAGINWADRDELRWHLARNGLIPPTHVSLLRRLAESVLSQAADAVFAVIPKLGIVTRDVCEVMPGWSTSADEMVLRAMQLDPDRLALVLDSANSLLRLGIQLVRGRSGVEIPASDRARILDSLAEIEAKQAGLPRTYSAQGERLSIQALGITGERSEPYDSAWSLAKHFGTQTVLGAGSVEAVDGLHRSGGSQGIQRRAGSRVIVNPQRSGTATTCDDSARFLDVSHRRLSHGNAGLKAGTDTGCINRRQRIHCGIHKRDIRGRIHRHPSVSQGQVLGIAS